MLTHCESHSKYTVDRNCWQLNGWFWIGVFQLYDLLLGFCAHYSNTSAEAEPDDPCKDVCHVRRKSCARFVWSHMSQQSHPVHVCVTVRSAERSTCEYMLHSRIHRLWTLSCVLWQRYFGDLDLLLYACTETRFLTCHCFLDSLSGLIFGGAETAQSSLHRCLFKISHWKIVSLCLYGWGTFQGRECYISTHT